MRLLPLVRVTEVKKLQRTLEQMIDFLFTHFVRSQQLLQVEVREASIRNTGGQKLAQTAGIHRAHIANFLKHHTMQRIFKHAKIEQLADLQPRPALDQHRAKKPQRIFLKLESGIPIMNKHPAALSCASSARNSQ